MALIPSRLREEILPSKWYNILPRLPEKLPPYIKPDGSAVKPSELQRVFARELVRQEFSDQVYIDIPSDVREAYLEIGRPTPLLRARRLEEYLDTKTRIYFKYEGATPTGSHKVNTALAQAYYNMIDGIERLVTETGAGQWGSALAFAGRFFGLKVRVYMVRVSYMQKPYRRTVMEIYGAEVYPSPSTVTEIGRKILEEEPDHPGSLGIAISEAIWDVLNDEKARYCLGSVLNHVLMHQTIIGLEAKKQMELLYGEYPDIIIGCVGGGSNFAGLAYPFLDDRLSGKTDTEFIAVEPRAAPSLTRGVYKYDYGDTAGLTPLLKMFTLGHKYRVPPIHAGGLRYHGMAPTISLLYKLGYIKAVAYHQTEVLEAAKLFAQLEGIIPAPESAHAIKAVIDIARKYRNERKTILFNLSGHGLLDLMAYRQLLDGKLEDYEPTEIKIEY
ncbi:TrpB-like pyridoxal phosphate-dependent enzyme [Desulfurococcaceae archaeon MEX13E-LK6-19]|nr:TrpB-like pyridoxal phosphate-dependent enzyme [Desulfurococcaceae archaeon MEX13E-LK6-19]